MLDQNTDRMWYVIGAVLIGAAIIFGMNTLMPEAFASVGDSFDSVISTVSSNVSLMDQPRNLFNMGNVTKGRQLNVSGDESHGSLGELTGDGWDATSEFMRISSGEDYIFSTTHATVVKRVAYYDAGKNYISGSKVGSRRVFKTTAPDSAMYVRISTDYNPESTAHSPLDTWWFGTEAHYAMLQESGD